MERKAPPGTIWVCAACGKSSPDKYIGPDGWDENCTLNSVLCKKVGIVRQNGRVIKAEAIK